MVAQWEIRDPSKVRPFLVQWFWWHMPLLNGLGWSRCAPSEHIGILHQQTLGALPDSTVVLIDGIVIHSTHSVCRNVYELRSAPVVLL